MLRFISSARNYWMNINIMNSNKMSELGNFDKYIEDLMAGQLLQETDIKMLCQKVVSQMMVGKRNSQR